MHLTDAYDIVIFAVRDNTQRIEIRLRGQAVKTLASHAGIRGSIPLGVTEKHLQILQMFFCFLHSGIFDCLFPVDKL